MTLIQNKTIEMAVDNDYLSLTHHSTREITECENILKKFITTAHVLDDDYSENVLVADIESCKFIGLNSHFDDIVVDCDSESQQLIDGFLDCFKKVDGCDAKLKIEKDSFEYFTDNFILIKEFVVQKEFRRKGYGKLIIKMLIEDLENNSILMVKPWAIEDEKNKEAHNQVIKFWTSLGFKKGGKNGFYVAYSDDLLSKFQ